MAFGVLYRGLATYSRGGFLASGVLALHFLMRAKRRVLATVGALVAVALISSVLPDAFWQRMNTIPTMGAARESEDVSILGRLHFWEVAVSMANDRPLTGVGHTAYNFVYDDYDTSRGAFGEGRSVHSSWFGILAELGYPGFFCFVLLCGGALLTTRRVRRRARTDARLTTLADLAAGLEGALLVFLVGGSFVPMQYNEMVWHVIILCLATGRVAAAIAAAPAVTPPVAAAAVPPVTRRFPTAPIAKRSPR
jgi:probable O-glycosylation ligase (exosortase A-associated)